MNESIPLHHLIEIEDLININDKDKKKKKKKNIFNQYLFKYQFIEIFINKYFKNKSIVL